MKLFVQARKDGYNILYPKTTPTEFYQFASDLRPIAKMGVSFLGKEIYSIAFSSGGCIFTKHIIVQDVQRESLGNVGFSIYIPNEKKLLGIEVKSLLDELLETYRENYCTDYYLNNKQADWILFQSLADSFDKKLLPVSPEDVDNYQSDNNVEAFVYYNNESELHRYFDAPFQEIYIPYKQVFFVDRNSEKMEDNPLNALKYDSNANLTGKIDLENPFYKLREFHGAGKNGTTITIKNSKGRVLYNKDKVYRKEELTIVYSKKHYHHKTINGSLLNSEEVRKYLIINENDKKIDVVKDLDLEPNPKTITFDVIKKKNSIKVNDAEIICKSNNYLPNKIVKNNQITFSPEEMEQQWIISANIISEHLYSDEIKIIPVNQEINVPIILNERVKVEITAINENGIVSDFNVRIREKNIDQKRTEIEFINDEIGKTYDIEISKEEDDNYYCGIDQFCPKYSNKIVIRLIKNSNSQLLKGRYHIDAGNKGKKSKSSPGYSERNDGCDLRSEIIICDKGWEFDGWKLNDEKNTLIAQYKKKESVFPKPIAIIGLILGVIILGLGIWSLDLYLKPDKIDVPIVASEIQDYVKGDALILDTLNAFKTNWKKQNPEDREEEGILSLLWSSSKETNSALQQNDWEQISKGLDSAITKREFVDNKNFAALIKLRYSSKQQQFKIAITKINSAKYAEVKNQLVDISNLTLTQIAYSINSILNKTSNENLKKQEEERAVKNLIKQKPETKQASPPSSKKIVITKPNEQVSASEDNTISRQLMSSSISKNQLSEYKEKFPTDKAIQLYLDFWRIITSNDKNDFDELLKKINNNNTLKNSELKKFLNTICKNEEEFNEFRSSSGRAKFETLDKLKANVK